MSLHPYTRLFILPSPPTVDEDASEGYEVGDTVHIDGGSIYVLRDSTIGAAVWQELSGSGLPLSPTFYDDIADGNIPLWNEDDQFFIPFSIASFGDVNGPGSAVIGNIPTFDLTSGKSITDSGVAIADLLTGWKPLSQTLTYASADDPVYQVYVSGDVTANPDFKLGNKIKCTNNATTFFGIIVKVGAYDAGNTRTPVDIYGGTDYDLANSAITAPYVSKVKSPDGFPLSPSKWTVEVTDNQNRLQNTPTQNVWYNLDAALQISVPIGLWDLEYSAEIYCYRSTVGQALVRSTLSTANNSESDNDYHVEVFSSCQVNAVQTDAGGLAYKRKVISLTSKTQYYLNAGTNQTGITAVYVVGANQKTIIRARSAYL